MQEPKTECYTYALHYIYRFPKSYRDLKAKLLEKQFASDEVQEAMDYLVMKGYVDDAKYVESYLSSECVNKGKPFLAIQNKLLQKGIDKNLIGKIYRHLREDISQANREKIWKEWQKLDKQGKNSMDIIEKLKRKGYRYEEIKQALLHYSSQKD